MECDNELTIDVNEEMDLKDEAYRQEAFSYGGHGVNKQLKMSKTPVRVKTKEMLNRERIASYKKVMEIIVDPYSYNFENYVNLITYPLRGAELTHSAINTEYFD